MCERMKLDPHLTLYTKTNSKWIKNLNVTLETINPLEENIKENLYDVGLGNYFTNVTAKVQATKTIRNR